MAKHAWVLALGFGACMPLSLAPFDWWPLGIVSVGGWFWLLFKTTTNGVVLGLAYGVGKFAVGVSWVYVSINVYGGAPPPLALFLVSLFVLTLSLFTMAQAWLYVWATQSRPTALPPLINAGIFCANWVAFEWLLTWFLTGFPWLYPGYGHLDTALANLAPLGGVSLVSLGVVASGCFLSLALLAKRRVSAILIAALPWALGFGLQFEQWVSPSGSKTVALVQGNIDQATKWLPENRTPIVTRYLELTEPHWDAALIVWPEAAITLLEHQAQDVLQVLDDRGKKENAAVVLGIPAVQRVPNDGYLSYNAAVAVGNAAGRYTKRQLVPFGEYVPFEDWLRGLIEFFDLPMSSSEPGPRRQPPLQLGNLAGAMAICYEVVYGELMRVSAEDADVLLTISNDTWFGSSIGPLQHMQIAQMRALENGRALVRSTNNGVTAIVDHRGRLIASLPQFEAGVLRGAFEVMEGRTPYNRFGDFWLVGLSLVVLLAMVVRFGAYRMRRRH